MAPNLHTPIFIADSWHPSRLEEQYFKWQLSLWFNYKHSIWNLVCFKGIVKFILNKISKSLEVCWQVASLWKVMQKVACVNFLLCYCISSNHSLVSPHFSSIANSFYPDETAPVLFLKTIQMWGVTPKSFKDKKHKSNHFQYPLWLWIFEHVKMSQRAQHLLFI